MIARKKRDIDQLPKKAIKKKIRIYTYVFMKKGVTKNAIKKEY